jgi:hypothetical protein
MELYGREDLENTVTMGTTAEAALIAAAPELERQLDGHEAGPPAAAVVIPGRTTEPEA